MANDKPTTGLARYVTEGELLTPPGQLVISINLDPGGALAAQLAYLRLRMREHNTAVRRIVLPSDRQATIIDQE